MVATSLCKRPFIAVAALLLAVVAPAAFAHGGGGGHGGGHGGHAGGVAGAHASASGGRFVGGGGPHVNGGGFRASGFHHGHWVHGVRGGQFGWFWVGAAAPLYVEPLAPAAVLVQPQAVYYCSVLQAYYPEVQSCPEPWLLVTPSPSPE